MLFYFLDRLFNKDVSDLIYDYYRYDEQTIVQDYKNLGLLFGFYNSVEEICMIKSFLLFNNKMYYQSTDSFGICYGIEERELEEMILKSTIKTITSITDEGIQFCGRFFDCKHNLIGRLFIVHDCKKIINMCINNSYYKFLLKDSKTVRKELKQNN